MEITLSYFLARFFGIYFLIFAILWLLRQNQIRDIIKDIFSRPALLAVTGIVSLILGVAIVVSHDIYEWSWRGFITLLGYLAIIKGISRIGFPKNEKKMAYSLIKGTSYWVCFLILLVIGLWLSYTGFNLSL